MKILLNLFVQVSKLVFWFLLWTDLVSVLTEPMIQEAIGDAVNAGESLSVILIFVAIKLLFHAAYNAPLIGIMVSCVLLIQSWLLRRDEDSLQAFITLLQQITTLLTPLYWVRRIVWPAGTGKK